MTVRDALAEGRLDQAIERAVAGVRDRPLDAAARLVLVDLLSLSGDWDRAAKQLDVLEASSPVEASGHRSLLAAARARSAFFGAGGTPPAWMIDPPAWADDALMVVDRFRVGDDAGARESFDRVEAVRAEVVGSVGGADFRGLRDLDDRLAPVLEVFGPGGYYWVPWDDLSFLDVAPPSALRDLLWAPARLALAGGPIGRVYLPTLYPGSEAVEDGATRLGRRTDWREVGSGLVTGLGLKVAQAGEEALGLFEWRDLRVLPESPAPSSGLA